MNLQIRPAYPEDTPVLVQIEQDCFSEPSWTAADFRQYACYVAALEGRVVGFLVVQQVFRGKDREPSECEILNLAVVPVARSLGVATALISNLMGPNMRLLLEVRQSNFPARNLYKKLGFEEAGSRPNYYANPSETAIVMTKK